MARSVGRRRSRIALQLYNFRGPSAVTFSSGDRDSWLYPFSAISLWVFPFRRAMRPAAPRKSHNPTGCVSLHDPFKWAPLYTVGLRIQYSRPVCVTGRAQSSLFLVFRSETVYFVPEFGFHSFPRFGWLHSLLSIISHFLSIRSEGYPSQKLRLRAVVVEDLHLGPTCRALPSQFGRSRGWIGLLDQKLGKRGIPILFSLSLVPCHAR